MRTTEQRPDLEGRWPVVLAALVFLVFAASARAQHLGVTCGFQYSSQLTGPLSYPAQFNISLYNPDPANPNATWDSWAEQLAQAGVDFVCPNLTGSQPNTGGTPSRMLPLLTALTTRGLTNRIKFGIFDDNAASWVAEWNQANGRGFGYAQKFDLADTNNWRYIYDYNYKLFYQAIPDANRFKIKGRPLIIIWTGNAGAFLTNMQGNASAAMTYVRQSCQRDFGFNPFIVLSGDFFSNDTTCTNAGIADGAQNWFTAGPSGPSWTLANRNGSRVGVAVSEFQHTGQSGFLNPNHGALFETGLSNTVGANALLTLCEGFTDYEEDAAMWRARNLDTNGATLGYSQTLYDFPNQRLQILRKHSNWPFPVEFKFEAEGCDYFGGANGGNGRTNYYRNGNIAIEPTTDAGGGHNIGWIQAGEWFEWEQVPIQGSQVHLQARVASPNNNTQLHFVIDGTNFPAMTIPNTGGYQSWATVDGGPFPFAKGSRHTVRIVCDTGGFNLNYWQYRDTIPIGVNIALQSKANNRWVSTVGTNLNANASVAGVSEVFTVVDASPGFGYGHVALLALATNKYVTADTNGVLPLTASAAAIGPNEIFQWTDNADGTITLRALANSKLVSATNSPASFPIVAGRNRNATTSETFTVSFVSSNTLSFVAQPNDAAAGTSITAGALGEVQVLALNASNTPVSGAAVTLSLASGSGALTGSSAVTDGSGIAHFAGLSIDRMGPKTLQAASAAFSPATSASFNITPAAQTSLSVETRADGTGGAMPAATIGAGSFTNVFAIARDTYGNFITNVSASWSLTNITGGVVAGDLVPAGDGRSATFTGHLVGSAIIKATATFAGQSGVQTVIGGAAANLVILQQPSATAKVGQPFAQQPTVRETDAWGNLSANPITTTETSGGSVNRNPSGVTMTPVNGVCAFTGLYVTNLGIDSLTFTAGSLSVTSSQFTVSIGNAERLVWTTPPGAATNGAPFGIEPVIQMRDAGGNLTSNGLPAIKYVLVSIYSGTGVLLGATITNIGSSGGNGIVTFANLSINSTGVFQLIAQDLGNGFNPTNITAAGNCQLWLDAADSSTLDSTVIGSTVTRWNDKSGRTNNGLGTATLAIDPLLTATSPGRAQTLRFNGSQQFSLKLNTLSNSPYTILVMEVGAAKTSGVSYFIGNSGGFNTDLTLGVGYQTPAQFRWQQYADDLNYNATFTSVTPRQWTMNLSATPTKRLYLNGNLVGTASSGFLTGTNLINGNVAGNSYLGDLAEIIVYNTSLTTNDQNNVQTYLMNKWLTGLSHAISQPFDVVAPVYFPIFNQVTSVTSNGAVVALALAGGSGPTNGSFRVLTSTNVAAPANQWAPILTNSFNGSGAFNFTVPVNPAPPARFYRLAVP